MTNAFISPHVERLIAMALDEDQVGLDVTSRIFFDKRSARARLIAKEPVRVAGLAIARAVFARVDATTSFVPRAEDGDALESGAILAEVAGAAVSLLGAERVALNFLQRMCGVAQYTAELVALMGESTTRLCDTRKTLPGWRELDKYAVRCGGGYNHRMALSGGVMLKDNHIAAAGGIARAVELARRSAPHALRIEVEVEASEAAIEAAEAGAEIIMLDNMSIEAMRDAIARLRARSTPCVIEISGNVDRRRLPELARLGVDVISVGAITHSIKAADISMRLAVGIEA